MNEIAKVKKEVKLAQWAEIVRQRNESELTVTDWCKQNGTERIMNTFTLLISSIHSMISKSN